MTQFEAPASLSGLSPAANAAIQLGALVGQLADEKRTIVWNLDGSAEDVAQHSEMLGVVAPVLAEQFFAELGLNADRVARHATVHDAVEAYAGDTPTHEIDAAGLEDKERREQAALQRLAEQYAHLPSFVRLIQIYADQSEPEARFVRVVDKMMPILTVFNDGGAGLRQAGISGSDLRRFAADKVARVRAEYPDFEAVVAVWMEIVELVASRVG